MTQEKKTSPIDPLEITTDQERRKVFLHYANLAWLILGIVTLASLTVFPKQREFIFLIGVTFPTYLIVRFLNLSRRTRLAGVIFTLSVNFGAHGKIECGDTRAKFFCDHAAKRRLSLK